MAVINSDIAPALQDSEPGLFHRRIEFHVARKPFTGFTGNGNSNGFKLVTLNPNSDSNVCSNNNKGGTGLSGNKYEKSELVETGLDPELSFEITFRRIGAGLRNLGNTCFLNSVLQCLTYTEPLAAYLQSGKHQNSCRKAGFCALCAIQKHVSRALQSTGRILEPKDLVVNLRCVSRTFRNARQEDAHEYMVNLLESMHKCCLPSGVPSESPSAYDKSLVHKIFGGRLRSQVKCMECSFCSNKFDPFLDLSLEIQKADTIKKALSHFTAKEQLDGGAKQYQCQQCKQKVRAVKQLTIHTAPHVLTVHLKRFSSLVPGQKIDKRVDFGPSLDLTPFVTGAYDGDLKYTLYGVLVHAGWSTHSGHYYCFIRTSSGMWYNLDDNQVIQVSEKKVLEQKAYMLFYVKDRRKFVTKKPVDTVQKENMVINAIGNAAAYSKFSMELKEKIQNGPVDIKVDASFANKPKEIPQRIVSDRTVNGTIAVHPPIVPPTKDSTVNESKEIPQEKVLDRSVNVKISVEHSPTKDSEMEDFTKKIISVGQEEKPVLKKELIDYVALPSNEIPSETAEQLPIGSVPLTSFEEKQKMGETNSEMIESKIMPMAISGEASNKVNELKSTKQNNIAEESQVEDSSRKNGNLISEETKEKSETLDSVQPATEQLSREIAKKKTPKLNVKSKHFKSQITTMSFSSSIIFGVANLRKKKHKQRKHRSLHKSSPTLENQSSENDLPSVSNKSVPIPINNCASSQKKKAKKHGSDDKSKNLSVHNVNGNSSTLSNITDKGFKERSALDGTTHSAPDIRHSADGNSEEQKRESTQNDVMSMLTRGLEETIVARWDDMDVSLSAKSEKRAAGTAQIGYIGDEWDEEYDKGKRKKIRESKILFGGPNLFQEVATKNSRRKRAKLERSGNQPLRI